MKINSSESLDFFASFRGLENIENTDFKFGPVQNKSSCKAAIRSRSGKFADIFAVAKSLLLLNSMRSLEMHF